MYRALSHYWRINSAVALAAAVASAVLTGALLVGDSVRGSLRTLTLVHDALYQYYPWHRISRRAIDALFLAMMQEKRFKLARLYYVAVRLLGGFGKKKHPSE